jgi:hypothetical protein
MGVDLKLLPVMLKGSWLCHDMIEVSRDRDLWDDVTKLPQQPIPQAIGCYLGHGKDGETCYGDIEETPYGERITYTTAGDLMSLKDHEAVRWGWKNKAIWAYLAQMPEDWLICLYWH